LARVVKGPANARLQGARRALLVDAACVKKDAQHPKLWIGVYAARNLDTLLSRIGKSSGVELSLEPPLPSNDRLQRTLSLARTDRTFRHRHPLAPRAAVDGRTARFDGAADRQRDFGLRALDHGAVVARPRPSGTRAGRASPAGDHGDPNPVVATGARELVEAAEAFNRAIADLVALRKRPGRHRAHRRPPRNRPARRHEIKNPLLPIRASVETLRRLRARNDPAFDEYFDEATRTVLDEVARISNIVGEFTRFARLPCARARAVQRRRRPCARSSRCTAPPARRSTSKPSRAPTVNADRDQVVQVVTNLVQNAQQALAGRANGRVTVRLGREQDKLVLNVSDNGPGIAPEMRGPPVRALRHDQSRRDRARACHRRAHRGRARGRNQRGRRTGRGSGFRGQTAVVRPDAVARSASRQHARAVNARRASLIEKPPKGHGDKRKKLCFRHVLRASASSGSSRMNRVSQRHLLAFAILAVGAIVLIVVLGTERNTLLAVGGFTLLAGYLVVSSGGDNSTELVETIASSVRRLVDGRKPEPPRDAPPAVLRLYEDLAEAHVAIKEAAEGGVDRDELAEAAGNLAARCAC
jgi:signal transduction histidine kinase